MFRKVPVVASLPRCFPRVRGDVPQGFDCAQNVRVFSPRARGCSVCSRCLVGGWGVFPACAGMFLGYLFSFLPAESFPRVRGDVPCSRSSSSPSIRFSPRARGCSAPQESQEGLRTVFPACAGMFRSWYYSRPSGLGFPRVRGDVPGGKGTYRVEVRFSPRARGCSDLRPTRQSCTIVFPACAGMFRLQRLARPSRLGFPRVRGDVPCGLLKPRCAQSFSPRARGCSGHLREAAAEKLVFPACAGMFRPAARDHRPANRFPRVRGDVP